MEQKDIYTNQTLSETISALTQLSSFLASLIADKQEKEQEKNNNQIAETAPKVEVLDFLNEELDGYEFQEKYKFISPSTHCRYGALMLKEKIDSKQKINTVNLVKFFLINQVGTLKCAKNFYEEVKKNEHLKKIYLYIKQNNKFFEREDIFKVPKENTRWMTCVEIEKDFNFCAHQFILSIAKLETAIKRIEYFHTACFNIFDVVNFIIQNKKNNKQVYNKLMKSKISNARLQGIIRTLEIQQKDA